MDVGDSHVTRYTRMTIAEWMRRYYKPERLNREPDAASSLIARKEEEFGRRGFTLISHHDSVSGRAEYYTGKRGLAHYKAMRGRMKAKNQPTARTGA